MRDKVHCQKTDFPEMMTFTLRVRLIGRIWLFWIRISAFDWSNLRPDPLDRDLVNVAAEPVCQSRGSQRHNLSMSAHSPRICSASRSVPFSWSDPDPEQA